MLPQNTMVLAAALQKAGQDKNQFDKYSLNFEEIHFAGTKFEMILFPDADHDALLYGNNSKQATEDFIVKCFLK